MNFNRNKKPIRVLFCEAGHHGGSVNRLLSFLEKNERTQIDPAVLTYYKDGKAGRLFELPLISIASMGLTIDPPPDTIRAYWKVPIPTLFFAKYLAVSIKTVRNYRPDLVYLNNTPNCHLPIIVACRIFNIPMVCHMRDTINLTKSERWVLDGISHVVVLSMAAKKHYASQGIPPEKMTVVYDGISIEEFDKKKNEGVGGIPRERFIIALIGSLIPRKKQIIAVRAVQQLRKEFPEVQLILYGDGTERESIVKYIEANRLQDHVIVHGWTENVALHLTTAHVGIMVSDREGMPNVVMEYMAASLPVVVTNLPGINEMVSDGENGFIVEVGDVEMLCDRLSLLLRDNGLRKIFGIKGRSTIESDKYSVKNEHTSIRTIINKVLKI